MSFQTSDVPRCRLFNANVTGTTETDSDIFNRETFNQHTLFAKVAAGGSFEVFLSASDRQADPDTMEWIKYGATVSADGIVVLNLLFRWIKLVRNAGTQSISATLLSCRPNR